MDFRVKKLILEEGMKNIAETEGVKLEMNFDSFAKKVTVDFHAHSRSIHRERSYSDLECEDADIFKTIEETRREVRAMLNPISAVLKAGIEKHKYVTSNLCQTADMVTALRESYARKSSNLPKIKKVIFNNPATIVLWADGDKTVVKCQPGDIFDAEKGLAMAIVKRAYGGKGNYCEILKPWIDKYEKEQVKAIEIWSKAMRAAIHEVLGVPDVSDAVKDIQDILEGKVDPMMIEKDEEEDKPLKDVVATFKSRIGTIRTCNRCKHGDLNFNTEPCRECLTKCAPNNVTPKWEPKE